MIEECLGPGVSIAAVALAHGLNANMLRKWLIDGEHRLAARTQPRALADGSGHPVWRRSCGVTAVNLSCKGLPPAISGRSPAAPSFGHHQATDGSFTAMSLHRSQSPLGHEQPLASDWFMADPSRIRPGAQVSRTQARVSSDATGPLRTPVTES